MKAHFKRYTKVIGIAIGAISITAAAATDRPIGPSWDALNKYIKPGYTANTTVGANLPGRDVMICFMPDSFVETFRSYAQWRHKTGALVKIVKFSDINATNTSASCTTAIKPYIEAAYKNWKYKPSHVLLIGDAGVFPLVKFVSATEGGMMTSPLATEEFFVEMDSSNGSEPEIMLGRLPVKTKTELTNMLQKIMNYETKPPTTNTEWFKRIVAISSNQTNSINGGGVLTGLPSYQAETVRYVSLLQMKLGFKVDTLMCTDSSNSMGMGGGLGGGLGKTSTGGTYGGGLGGYKPDTPNVTVDQVITSINKGCAFINYRGTGWSNGWMTPCYNFYAQQFKKVSTGAMLPFVTGVGCGINMFDESSSTGIGIGGTVTTCFGQLWMNAGTGSSPNGAVAVLAPPGETHSYWNNAMDSSLYIGLLRSGLWSTGHALVAAVDGMYKVPLNRDTTEYLAKCYLLLGDPCTHVWQDVPVAATITGPTKVDLGKCDMTFTVKANGQPVKNAQVTVSGDLKDTVAYATGYTDANGSIKFSMNVPKDCILNAYALGKNIIPVEQKITAGSGIGTLQNFVAGDASFTLNAGFSRSASSATIRYSLPKSGNATVAIYSVSGAIVKALASGMQSAGYHSITWDGKSDQGVSVARGVYFVALKHENSSIRQKLTKI